MKMRTSLIVMIVMFAAGAALFLGGTACAEDAMKITLPESDLVTSAKPFTVLVELPEGAAGEAVRAEVVLQRTEPGLDAAALPAEVTLPAGGAVRRLVINAASLAEGEYAGKVTVGLGNAKHEAAFTMFRMPEGRPRQFPFGIYAPLFPKEREGQQQRLDEMHAAGINLVQDHMALMGRNNWIYDRAARLGMQFMPSCNSIGWRFREQPQEMKARLSNGENPRWPWACINNPTIREKASEAFAQFLKEYVRHPSFSGMVYYGDDLTLPVKHAGGKTAIACYCDYCVAQFKALTGLEPPRPDTCEKRSGIIPADDPLLQWMRYRCGTMHGGFIAEMRKAKDSVDPAIKLGLIHGWSEQPFVNIAAGIYCPLSHAAADVVSSYCYPNLRSPRMDLITEYEIAKMGNRDKQVWMLGIIGMNHTVWPDWQIHQNYWNMLAAGYRLISFFSWNDIVRAAEKGGTQQAREAVEALTVCGKHKDWLLPVAAFWKVPPARNALLFSFTTEACNVMPEFRGREHLEDVTLAYRESLRRHTPMEIICEEEIRDGILERFDTLCLYAVQAIPDDVHAAIETWAAKGGKVYLDRCNFSVKGGLPCSLETMMSIVRDRTRRPVVVSSPHVTSRELVAGDGHYFIFINNFTDQYWAIPFDYGNPQVNYDRCRLVRNEPVEATAVFQDTTRWLFDMSSGEMLGRSDKPLLLKLAPAWGLAVAALPADRAVLNIEGRDTAKTGDTAKFRIRIADARGQVIRAAFALRANVATPSGRTSRYSCFFGIENGEGSFVLPIGANDETGDWTLAFEGGFPRRKVTKVLRVTPGEPIRALADGLAGP